jgi:hypothetical protein
MTKRSKVVASTATREAILRDERTRLYADIAEAIAAPVDLQTDPEHPDGYLLIERAQLIARWREAEHPGLAAWMATRMHERWAALQLARQLAPHTKGQRMGGANAAGKSAAEKKRPALVKQIEWAIRRGEDPREWRDTWPAEFRVSRTTFYELVKRVEIRLGKGALRPGS